MATEGRNNDDLRRPHRSGHHQPNRGGQGAPSHHQLRPTAYPDPQTLKSLRIQHPGHGLQLVKDDPAQVDVVHGADQQDHVEAAARQGDVVHLGDGAQLVAQFPPGILLQLQGYVGGGLESRLDRVHDRREPGRRSVAREPSDPGVGVGPGDVDVLRHRK